MKLENTNIYSIIYVIPTLQTKRKNKTSDQIHSIPLHHKQFYFFDNTHDRTYSGENGIMTGSCCRMSSIVGLTSTRRNYFQNASEAPCVNISQYNFRATGNLRNISFWNSFFPNLQQTNCKTFTNMLY